MPVTEPWFEVQRLLCCGVGRRIVGRDVAMLTRFMLQLGCGVRQFGEDVSESF